MACQPPSITAGMPYRISSGASGGTRWIAALIPSRRGRTSSGNSAMYSSTVSIMSPPAACRAARIGPASPDHQGPLAVALSRFHPPGRSGGGAPQHLGDGQEPAGLLHLVHEGGEGRVHRG